jgi:hypothetical protein
LTDKKENSVKGNIRTLKLLLTAAAMLPVVCSSFITEPEEMNPRIMGIVTDEDSVRLAGVRVTTYDGEWTYITDSDGRFSFDSLDTGTYDLRFTLQGYETGIVEDIKLSDEHPGRKYWVVLRYPAIPRPVSGSLKDPEASRIAKQRRFGIAKQRRFGYPSIRKEDGYCIRSLTPEQSSEEKAIIYCSTKRSALVYPTFKEW